MKYLGKVQEAKDLVNVEYVSEVDTQIRDDLSPLITAATEVIISDTEPTGNNKRVLWVDPTGSSSSDEGKEIVVSSTRPDSFTAWIDTSATYNDTNSTIGIADGGTGATTATNARSNLQVALKPKLLWTGSWQSGSLTASGISEYTFLIGISHSGALDAVPMLMYKTSSIFRMYGATLYGGGGVAQGMYGTVSNNTLSPASRSIATITALYGLVKSSDILG